MEAYLVRVWIPCSVTKFAVFRLAVDEVKWRRTSLYVNTKEEEDLAQ